MGAVLSKAIILILIICAGYFLKRFHIIEAGAFRPLSVILMHLTLPCTIITSLNGAALPLSLLFLVALGLLGNVFTVAAGYCFNRTKADRAFAMINLSGFNIGCFVLPFIQTFFGVQALTALFLFDAGNSMMCTGGTLAVAASVAGQQTTSRLKNFCKKLFRSVPFDVYMIMFALALLGIRLPSPVLDFSDVVGRCNSFLAMLMVGVGLELPTRLRQFKFIGKLLGQRLLLSLLLAVLFFFLPFEYEIRRTLMLMAFSPISTLCSVFTEEIGGDTAMAANLTSVSIIASTVLLMIGLTVL